MGDQDLRLDHRAGGNRFLRQRAVEARHAHEIGAVLGHRQDDGAAEAIADGGNAARVDAWIRLDQIVGRHEALLADARLDNVRKKRQIIEKEGPKVPGGKADEDMPGKKRSRK